MLDGAEAWCWDARPWPSFPALGDEWADAGAWRTGHWLNGRLTGDGEDLLAAILRRGGLGDQEFQIGGTDAVLQGYVIDRPMRTRDALEPLLSAFGLVATERDGGIALIEDGPATVTLAKDALALPDDGVAIVRKRNMEAVPTTARVRFIDEGADYQTGSVTVRTAGEGDAGALDLVLPAVCGAGLATGMGQRALAGTQGDLLIVALGPLEVLRLETGDIVGLEGEAGAWRVESLTLDEAPTATLSLVIAGGSVDLAEVWRPADPPVVYGAPLLAVLDLPPLPGREDDARPVVAMAADPWRPMRVFAGTTSESLTQRGDVTSPACVGVLTEALSPGVVGRWDEANAIVVRIEGRAPASLGEAAVLGGANAVVVQAGEGWEIVQFRTATLIGQSLWRLSGLLRAQQGTDAEMAAGSDIGGMVVFLDDALSRASLALSEVGLPLIWRAGPAGGPPGGPLFAEQAVTLRGLHNRPWSPAHLRVRVSAGGLAIGWIARSRLNGDVWDRDVCADPMLFRLRVLNNDVVVRTWEVEGASALYETSAMASDFPGGIGPGVRIAVEQDSVIFGWGVEAIAPVPA